VNLAGDRDNPDLHIARKYLWTAKDTWLGSEQDLGTISTLYNLTIDAFEKYDMVFTGAVPHVWPQPRRGSGLGGITAGPPR
jgi:hypothetical protein